MKVKQGRIKAIALVRLAVPNVDSLVTLQTYPVN